MVARPAYDEPRREAAADWVIKLQSPELSAADGIAFDAWLAAAPENALAYDAALATADEYEANATEVLQGLRGRAVRPSGSLPGFRRLYLGLGGAAAAAVAALAIVPQLSAPATQDYVTGKGQHRTVELADGSRIDLNGGTRLSVILKRGERDVTLAQGEAAFDVAHDARRPFIIAAGDRNVRVVGTQFNVRRREGRLSVAVTRGAVEVLPAGDAPGMAFRLHPGERLDHVEGQAAAQVAAFDPAEALSWRTGRLVYRGQPLSQVVADLNAQFARPIRVSDPALAAQPISGVLVLDNEDAVVRRLALLVSAHPVTSDGGVILQRDGTPDR